MDSKLNLQAKLPSRHLADGRDRPAEIIKRTWCIADLTSTGRYVAKDLLETGGVPLLMRTLLDHGTGRVVAENLKRVKRSTDQSVVHPADKPLFATSGVVGLQGNLAPHGATAKVAGLADLQFIGSARCFYGGGACFAAGKNKEEKEGGEGV